MDNELMMHIRYEGRSWDFAASTIDVGDGSTDGQIREAVAQHLEVPVGKMAQFTIEKTPGNITISPSATFGK